MRPKRKELEFYIAMKSKRPESFDTFFRFEITNIKTIAGLKKFKIYNLTVWPRKAKNT